MDVAFRNEISLADLGLRFIFSNIWGRITDKTGYIRALGICLVILFAETVIITVFNKKRKIR